MSSAVAARKTVLVWNYRELLELLSISGPTQKRDTIDVTSHDSTDKFREFMAGPIAPGEIAIEGNFIAGDAAGQIAFHTDVQGGTKRAIWVVLPMAVGVAMSMDAFATGFEPGYPHDGKIGASGTLAVTGKPTLYTTQSAGISAMTATQENGPAPTITPDIAAGTYAYACTVNTTSDWVKLTVTAADHTIKAQGATQTSGVQGGEIALGAAGTDTVVFIMVYEANKAPRLYRLTVTRPAA